jgi:hypothetical protein
MARETAKRNEAAIPEKAAGTTARNATCRREKPRAYAASNSEERYIASSLKDETMGTIN